MNELIQIENLNAVEIFKTGGIDPILKAIEKEVIDFIPDVSTDKGRKEIASRAYKVAQSKTAIDAAGKKLADELNAQLAPINSERKKARDFCDALKDKVREPLTVWEAREKARKEEQLNAIKTIKDWSLSDNIQELETFEKFTNNLDLNFYSEILTDLNNAIELSKPLVEQKIALLKKQKADQEELERLRIAEAARLQKEREQEIAKQAAERAEHEKNEAIARAERERLEAIERAKQAAAQAEKDKQAAVIAERQRIELETRQAKEIEAAKAANKEHQRIIHQRIIQELSGLISEDLAKQLIIAICKGDISTLSINY